MHAHIHRLKGQSAPLRCRRRLHPQSKAINGQVDARGPSVFETHDPNAFAHNISLVKPLNKSHRYPHISDMIAVTLLSA
jgi:hypothetical protein